MNRPNGHISRESFDALYADYKPRFVRIAQSYVRNGHVAEDIVTDSFLYLWEHRAELTITASLPAYVLGAVKHGCLEWLRNEKNRLNIRQQIHTTAYHSIQARITALEAATPASSSPRRSPRSCRRRSPACPSRCGAYSSPALRRQDYQEIADTTGISVRNVKAAIQRALGIMREALKDYLPAWLISLLLSEMRF